MDLSQFTLPSTVTAPLDVVSFLLNLFLCVFTGFLLRFVYLRKSISLSGKYHIGTVLPLLAVVTYLIIVVVKSSLALSLGLVGALSIVRFRTPIKEPEELLYLFLAIALGLGYGAGQIFVTSSVFAVLIAIIVVWSSTKLMRGHEEYNLMIEWPSKRTPLEEMTAIIAKYAKTADVRRFNATSLGNSLFLKVNISKPKDIVEIQNAVQAIEASAVLSFSEVRILQ